MTFRVYLNEILTQVILSCQEIFLMARASWHKVIVSPHVWPSVCKSSHLFSLSVYHSAAIWQLYFGHLSWCLLSVYHSAAILQPFLNIYPGVYCMSIILQLSGSHFWTSILVSTVCLSFCSYLAAIFFTYFLVSTVCLSFCSYLAANFGHLSWCLLSVYHSAAIWQPFLNIYPGVYCLSIILQLSGSHFWTSILVSTVCLSFCSYLAAIFGHLSWCLLSVYHSAAIWQPILDIYPGVYCLSIILQLSGSHFWTSILVSTVCLSFCSYLAAIFGHLSWCLLSVYHSAAIWQPILDIYPGVYCLSIILQLSGSHFWTSILVSTVCLSFCSYLAANFGHLSWCLLSVYHSAAIWQPFFLHIFWCLLSVYHSAAILQPFLDIYPGTYCLSIILQLSSSHFWTSILVSTVCLSFCSYLAAIFGHLSWYLLSVYHSAAI